MVLSGSLLGAVWGGLVDRCWAKAKGKNMRLTSLRKTLAFCVKRAHDAKKKGKKKKNMMSVCMYVCCANYSKEKYVPSV